MILASHGIIGSSIVQFVPTGNLLEDYPGAAAAYSLRALDPNNYGGNAIRVRRASDNTEQDIGFVSGELDTSTLTSFCSGTNGFVKTWYDQSGNARDATQTSASAQPQIVSSGSVITNNAKPSIQWSGNNGMSLIASIPVLSEFDIFGVFTQTNVTDLTQGYFSIESGTTALTVFDCYINQSNFRGRIVASNGTFDNDISYTGILNNQYLYNWHYTNGDFELYQNNTSKITSTPSTLVNNSSRITIGASVLSLTASYVLYGDIQEFILYPSDQSSNQTGISPNINDFYSIY